MRLLALGLAVVVMGCGRAEPVDVPESQKPVDQSLVVDAEAEIQDALAVDGCRLLITVGENHFGPDPASVATLDKFLSTASSGKATMTFRLTGKTTAVECGWGSKMKVPEVAIQSVAAR